MKIESIRLKNFKSFKETELKNIPKMCVVVGANGTGKSTLFDVFGFLKDALINNVDKALSRRGGFSEVRSRDCDGPIEIEIKFRDERIIPKSMKQAPVITYLLSIDERNGKILVDREILKYRRLSRGKPWHFLDFSNGKGSAVTNEMADVSDESELERDNDVVLADASILALKGLAQFEKFPAVASFGRLIENWHVSDFHISSARQVLDDAYAEHLSSEGENLALVTQFLFEKHKEIFDSILNKLEHRVPGISQVEAKSTEEGRVLLKFKDGNFKDPFLSRYVSDGTIKMFAYLVLLHDPAPHPLLCIEEPENQLYPNLLMELAEEFRSYAQRGGQVMISTHSPDFLNAIRVEEVYWLRKEKGYTTIEKAADDEQIVNLIKEGDLMGALWKQNLLNGADPQ